MALPDDLTAIAEETDFSGVVLVAQGERRLYELARGDANRAWRVPNELTTRFSVASVTKGLTALTIAGLIESGRLTFDSTLVDVLGERVSGFVDERVTIRHLLGHTSGVGDYVDEDEAGDVDDPSFAIAPGDLDTPSACLPLLAACPQRDVPGEVFRYNNSGFVLLAIAAEAAGGESYFDLVRTRVTEPAGMVDTAFLRSDDLPGGVALGYLASGRTNVFKLPVRGAGDGGAYSTVADLHRLWTAFVGGSIVSLPMVEELTALRHLTASGNDGYGLGFWMSPDGHAVQLEGYDAAVSCRTVHDRTSDVTYAVIANTSAGAWPLANHLDERIRTGWTR